MFILCLYKELLLLFVDIFEKLLDKFWNKIASFGAHRGALWGGWWGNQRGNRWEITAIVIVVIEIIHVEVVRKGVKARVAQGFSVNTLNRILKMNSKTQENSRVFKLKIFSKKIVF